MMLTFDKLLEQAKADKQSAFEELLQLFKPLLIHNAIVDRHFDEDLYQELCITFLKCIQLFRIP